MTTTTTVHECTCCGKPLRVVFWLNLDQSIDEYTDRPIWPSPEFGELTDLGAYPFGPRCVAKARAKAIEAYALRAA